MSYLIKSKESGEMTIHDDVSHLNEESFDTVQVYHMSEITKDNFEEEIKRFQILEIQRQQQLLNQQLQKLMGDNASVSPVIPTSPINVANSNGSVPPPLPPMINPATKQPYTKEEVSKAYTDFDADVMGRSEDVIFTENAGDHFIAVVTQKTHDFPKNIRGIPIVQMLEEEHMNING
jgi:hypothetical protein